MATMDPTDLELVTKRLKRAQGQLGGIIRMLEENRDCRDIVTQLAAVSKAIDRAGFAMIATGLKACATNATSADDSAGDGAGNSAVAAGASSDGANSPTDTTPHDRPCPTVAELEKLFLSLA